MHSYIIVPDGVAADKAGTPLPRPSFVYRQVLDYIIFIARSDDFLYLAPANCCNGSTEHELAYTYIKENSRQALQVYCPPVIPDQYIDTLGNAVLLKNHLPTAVINHPCELVCAHIHSYRAEYCFRKAGFTIGKVHRVPYRRTGEPIMRRWWYYNYKPIHCVYEIFAFIRDIVRNP
ncbi:MAG: YdcF family protein [Deltaproteobacteria bacterium]|nr:YdcF family protein [Deltaproteobacteria bacterium]